MKTLLLLRHAKSSRDNPSLNDFDRPLEERGHRDAPRMGTALKERGPVPDLVICSPALRAKETIDAFARAAELNAEIHFDEHIYGATSAELLAIIHRVPDTCSTLLMVGHNPGFEDLTNRLTGLHETMPTAALSCMRFQIDRWEDIEDGKGTLLWLLIPKQLK
jgi:phosphohistidine phosphatase